MLEAKDSFEAVEVFRHHQDEIRCVISDLTMPRMDGWGTLAALRNLSPDIPVILSRGYDEAQVPVSDGCNNGDERQKRQELDWHKTSPEFANWEKK